MDWTANVAVHESASPAILRERILSALQNGRIHPHLLYSGLRQTSLWTALHHAFSPSQTDPSCVDLYETAFKRATESLRGNVGHVVSLCCGDGSKDLRALQQIRASRHAAIYTPVDIGLEMVLTASRRVLSALPGLQTTPLLCDVPHCSVLPAILKGFDPSGAERILLFLGTIHNYWPPEILRSILYPLRSQDQLLISANLAPADSYDSTLEAILAQYDNEPTRKWLMGALSELPLGDADGELKFQIGTTPDPTLKRIEANFHLSRAVSIRIFDTEVTFKAGQSLSVFFSHRFTTTHIRQFLEQAGLAVSQEWIGASGQEGLFLSRRAS